MKIYGDVFSGNCYKLKLCCALLDIHHEWIAVDILKRETLSDEFLAMNPAGKIPVLETGKNGNGNSGIAITNYTSTSIAHLGM